MCFSSLSFYTVSYREMQFRTIAVKPINVSTITVWKSASILRVWMIAKHVIWTLVEEMHNVVLIDDNHLGGRQLGNICQRHILQYLVRSGRSVISKGVLLFYTYVWYIYLIGILCYLSRFNCCCSSYFQLQLKAFLNWKAILQFICLPGHNPGLSHHVVAAQIWKSHENSSENCSCIRPVLQSFTVSPWNLMKREDLWVSLCGSFPFPADWDLGLLWGSPASVSVTAQPWQA